MGQQVPSSGHTADCAKAEEVLGFGGRPVVPYRVYKRRFAGIVGLVSF